MNYTGKDNNSYYEDYLKKNPSLCVCKSSICKCLKKTPNCSILTDRNSYMSYLEEQLDRITRVCMASQSQETRVNELYNMFENLEAREHSNTKLISLSQKCIEEIRSEIYTALRQQQVSDRHSISSVEKQILQCSNEISQQNNLINNEILIKLNSLTNIIEKQNCRINLLEEKLINYNEMKINYNDLFINYTNLLNNFNELSNNYNDFKENNLKNYNNLNKNLLLEINNNKETLLSKIETIKETANNKEIERNNILFNDIHSILISLIENYEQFKTNLYSYLKDNSNENQNNTKKINEIIDYLEKFNYEKILNDTINQFALIKESDENKIKEIIRLNNIENEKKIQIEKAKREKEEENNLKKLQNHQFEHQQILQYHKEQEKKILDYISKQYNIKLPLDILNHFSSSTSNTTSSVTSNSKSTSLNQSSKPIRKKVSKNSPSSTSPLNNLFNIPSTFPPDLPLPPLNNDINDSCNSNLDNLASPSSSALSSSSTAPPSAPLSVPESTPSTFNKEDIKSELQDFVQKMLKSYQIEKEKEKEKEKVELKKPSVKFNIKKSNSHLSPTSSSLNKISQPYVNNEASFESWKPTSSLTTKLSNQQVTYFKPQNISGYSESHYFNSSRSAPSPLRYLSPSYSRLNLHNSSVSASNFNEFVPLNVRIAQRLKEVSTQTSDKSYTTNDDNSTIYSNY